MAYTPLYPPASLEAQREYAKAVVRFFMGDLLTEEELDRSIKPVAADRWAFELFAELPMPKRVHAEGEFR